MVMQHSCPTEARTLAAKEKAKARRMQGAGKGWMWLAGRLVARFQNPLPVLPVYDSTACPHISGD